MHVDMASLSKPEAYALLTQTIIPRPVAWVLSDNGTGSWNLAPYSFFNAVCSAPPTIMISIGIRPDGSVKDTRANIEARKRFVVNIAHREMAEPMTQSSASFPAEVSEVDTLGLELAPMPEWDVPRLAACRVAFACELSEVKMLGQQALVFAEIHHVHIDESVLDKDYKGRMKVDGMAVDAIGRLGGGEYVTAGDLVYVERPD